LNRLDELAGGGPEQVPGFHDCTPHAFRKRSRSKRELSVSR
jgi:hypothetical protein